MSTVVGALLECKEKIHIHDFHNPKYLCEENGLFIGSITFYTILINSSE